VRHFLELCLESVQAATKSIDSEIIVIDNNSPDDSCAMIKQLFPEVVLIENSENVGFSKANNQGVAIAKGEYICVLNPDTVVTEKTFTDILEFASSKSNLGIIGCKLIDGTGQFLPESKRNLPVVKVAFQKIRGNSTNYYANHIDESDIANVQILVGAFMFMKRETFNDLKGFDEDYFMYGEDIDLSYKALQKGYSNYYFGKTTVIHYKGESTLKDTIYAKRFYKAMQIFYKKHFRSNILFDAFVWIGIIFAYFIRKEAKVTKKSADKYYLFTDGTTDSLKGNLNKDIIKNPNVGKIKENSLVMFDTHSVSFYQIIKHILELGKKDGIMFRILPKHKQFIIGSDCSFARGEVLLLKKN